MSSQGDERQTGAQLAGSPLRRRTVLLLLVVGAALAAAPTRQAVARKPAHAPLSSYGSISVGHPDVGVLVNAVRMPESEHWELTAPGQAYATSETVEGLRHCIEKVRGDHPGAPAVRLGSLSGPRGGKLPPHRSHRTGRDADVYFFRKPGGSWLEAATRDDLDLDLTWALLRCFITDTDVDFLLVERRLHPWFEDHARSIGEDPGWIRKLFHDGPGRHRAVVRHAPGHVAHVHVRFVSPESRRRAAELYDRLVREGLVPQAHRTLVHRVRAGDTLLALAKRYRTSVRNIQRLNGLESAAIVKGQKLTIRQPTPLRGVKKTVVVPPRRLPPSP